nr:MAG TPA: hypothetical protein [Caudoviricetes sp.]
MGRNRNKTSCKVIILGLRPIRTTRDKSPLY